MASPEYAKVAPLPDAEAADKENSAGEASAHAEEETAPTPQRRKGTSKTPGQVLARAANSKMCRAMFQVFVCAVLWFIICFVLFILPNLTKYKYVHGSFDGVKGKYDIKSSFIAPSKEVTLTTADKWDGASGSAAGLASYPDMVNIPTDRDGDPGWYVQDLVDVPRPSGLNPGNAYSLNGKRMIEDVRYTDSVTCPYTWVPEKGACYRDREAFLSDLDGDFVQANYHLFKDNTKNPLASFYGNYGLPNVDNAITESSVTSGKFVCNLGRKRMGLGSIVIKSKGCSVQVAAREGSGYHVWARVAFVDGITYDVTNKISANATTGCRGYDVEISVVNNVCDRPMLPGMTQSCSEKCSIVLFKGDKARRVPIVINPDPSNDAPTQTFTINDPSLVLDNGRAPAPWEPAGPADISVSKGNMDVSLSLARVKVVSVATLGTISLNQLRFDGANLEPRNDLVIQDSRDFELRYRSAAQFLCLSSPVVEDIPLGFMPCDMKPASAPNKHIHIFYDQVTDGFIDRAEFAAGITRLGLDFEDDSLNLNPEQQTRLYDHVFKQNNPDAAGTSLPYDLFQAQMEKIATYFTTMYDTSQHASYGNSVNPPIVPGTDKYYFTCASGAQPAEGMTDASFGQCQPEKGCSPTCGNPDTSIDGYSTAAGQINYQYYDVDPPDGIVTYEEARQALLKLYGNCTYVIEPGKGDYATCRYVGGGQYESMNHNPRRECQTYSGDKYDSNKADWRYNNTGLPESWIDAYQMGDTGRTYTPRECRPFPDYNPDLNNKMYCGQEFGGPDPSCSAAEISRQSSAATCPECFMNTLTLTQGERVPPQYYNRSTWDSGNYNLAISLLKDIFNEGNVGNSYFPYFNISDDDQYRLFASKLFSKTVVLDRVDYGQFDMNMQTLNRVDGVGDNYYLFNPGCYRGKFMKVGMGAWRGATAEQIQSAFIEYDSASPSKVVNSNMPNYKKSYSPGGLSGNNPCPDSWNTQGTFTKIQDAQAGTEYSSFVPQRTVGGETYTWPDERTFPKEDGKYFSTFAGAASEGANKGRGYKWGKALPPRCMDEVWPNGGIDGKYPNDANVYGSYANKPILPGCELMTCKPMAKSNVYQSSIHAQVLPFEFDASNATGHYQSMISNCTVNNLMTCFFRGYETKAFNRFTRNSAALLGDLSTQYVSRTSNIFSFIMYDVVGLGLPTFQKFFWASVPTYLMMEPAWISAFSAGTLTPKLINAKVRMSPGYCQSEYGAVESFDWHSNSTVLLRESRSTNIYDSLVANTRPATEATIKGGIELKQLWRTDLQNESLATSQSTHDPVLDTRDDDGNFFLHKKICIADVDTGSITMLDSQGVVTTDATKVGDGTCAGTELDVTRANDPECKYSVIYKDNCKVERKPVMYDCRDKYKYYRASPCESGGESALTIRFLGEEGAPTFNMTSYILQSPLSAGQYTWDMTKAHNGEDVLSRNVLTGDLYVRFLNSTKNFYTEYNVFIDAGTGEHVYQNYRNAWLSSIMLATCVLLSLIIAATLGLGVAAILTYIGIIKLDEFNVSLADRNKLLESLREGKRKRVLNIMLNDKIRATLKLDPGEANNVTLSDKEEERYLDFMAKNGWNVNGLALEDWDVNFMVAKCRDIDNLEKRPSSALTSSALSFGRSMTLATRGVDTAALKMKMQKFHNMIRSMLKSKNPITKVAASLILALVELKKIISKLLSLEYPSPFTVVNLFIESQVRSRLINSVKAFVTAKCVRDHAIEDNEEIRVGGSIIELKEFVEGKKVIRLGVDSPVGIAKTIYGRYVHYKVKYVVVSVTQEKYTGSDGREYTGSSVHIKEGPRTYNSANVGKDMLEFEKSCDLKDIAVGDTREFTLPGLEAGTGAIYNMVIKAGYGTRTIQIETTGALPMVRLKTIYRNFANAYEEFVMANQLSRKDILKSQGTLASLGISMIKRQTELVKGIRMKTEADRMAERDRAEKVRMWLQLQSTKDVASPRAEAESANADALESAAKSLEKSASDRDAVITVSGKKKEYASGLATVLDGKGDASADLTVADEDAQEEEELDFEAVKLTTLELDRSALGDFVRSQYCVSGQFAVDFEEKAVFEAKYRKWCTRNNKRFEEVDVPHLESFNTKVKMETFYDMFGCTVNERITNVAKPSIFFTYTLLALSVLAHVAVIFAIPYPLLATVFSQSFLYAKTTAVTPQFTFEQFRSDPFLVYTMYHQPPENIIVITICYAFFMFATVKLFLFYMGYSFEKSGMRIMIKSIFYLYANAIMAMIVSLVVLECCWMLLGAIIKPDEFLPYCAAVMTVVGTAQTQKKYVEGVFASWKASIAAAVAFAFAMKVKATCVALRIKMETDPDDPKLKDTKKTWTAKDTVPPFDVFKLHAGEDDSMNFEEFSALLDRFDIEMIESKRRLVFNRMDMDGSGAIKYKELESAWEFIQDEIAEAELVNNGITRTKMLMLFLYAMIILAMILLFIFVGVTAFVLPGGSSFGACVNSGLTTITGGVMSLGKSSPKSSDVKADITSL